MLKNASPQPVRRSRGEERELGVGLASHWVKNLHNADMIRGRPSASVNKSNFPTADSCHGCVSGCIPKRDRERKEWWMWCFSRLACVACCGAPPGLQRGGEGEGDLGCAPFVRCWWAPVMWRAPSSLTDRQWRWGCPPHPPSWDVRVPG